MLKWNSDFWKNFIFRTILHWIKHDFMSCFGQSHFMCFENELKKAFSDKLWPPALLLSDMQIWNND